MLTERNEELQAATGSVINMETEPSAEAEFSEITRSLNPVLNDPIVARIYMEDKNRLYT
jgi:hypothetical protein